MKKRINILRLCSGLLAAVTLLEWTILGFATPVVRAMLADFDVHPDAMAWPYPHVLSLHWSWTPIVGLILAAGLILKAPRCLVWVAEAADSAGSPTRLRSWASLLQQPG